MKLGFPRHPFAQKLCECGVTPRFRELCDAFAFDIQNTVDKPELGAKMLEHQVLTVWAAIGGEGWRQSSVLQGFISLLEGEMIFHERIQAGQTLHLRFTTRESWTSPHHSFR